MMKKISIAELLREPFKKPSPLEVIAAELAEAHLAKLEAETAVEYAQSIVDYANSVVEYNRAVIARLNARIEAYK